MERPFSSEIENALVRAALKGGSGSGNWAHTSTTRRGIGRGGSDPGGGLRGLGVTTVSLPEERRAASQEVRQRRQRRGVPTTSAFARAITEGKTTSDKALQGGVTHSSIIEIQGPDGKTYKAIQKPMYAQGGAHDGNSEVAAARVAKVMGIDRVPETEFVMAGKGIGGGVETFDPNYPTSIVQRFIPNAETFSYHPDDYKALTHDVQQDVIGLDIVIGNADRHNQNWVVDKGGKGRLWMIDHGHAAWAKFEECKKAPMRKTEILRGDRPEQHGSFSFDLEHIRRWSQITRAEWDVAFEGIDQGRNVDADNAWDNLQYILDQGGLIRW